MMVNFVTAQSWDIAELGGYGIPGSNTFREIFKKVNFVDLNDVEGSAYNDSIYKTATFYYKDNQKIAECLSRYNGYSDEIEMMNSNGTFGSLKKVDFLRVNLNSKLFVVSSSPDFKNGESGFFIEKVINEKCSLYFKESKSFIKAIPAKSGYHTATKSKFVDESNYYIKFGNGALRKIPQSKSKLLKLFPDKRDNLKAYISENKIDLKKESDIIKLINYYNTL